MTNPEYVVTVHNIPAGQGAIRFSRFGHGYHANAKQLKPWREQIHAAAAEVIPEPLTGPVVLEATVTLRKPKSAPKDRETWPIGQRSGDWDHYGRAISDALTGVAYLDDSQIVDGTTRKVYPNEGLDSLTEPGAVIRVSALGGDAA